MTTQWFAVDKAGLGRQAEEHSRGRLIGELVQNALDEDGVTKIDITLALAPGRPLADLSVEDDSPEGFRDLTHAYTLFAESYKRDNPEKRGQFNLGEKFVLAVCEEASISTTKGTVLFTDEGRTEKPRQKRERGSVFQGRIKMTREEFVQVDDYLRSLLLPEGVVVTYNGDVLQARKPIRTFEASLETVVADDQGVMRPRVRKTQVSLFEPLPEETPGLYEMGLPIVETGDKWHVNIGQRVPLTRDRDNVKPAYLKALRVAVLNAAYDLLTVEDEATAVWTRLAGSDPHCSDEAIKHLIRLRFGEKVASPDPSDTESMKRFQSQGGTIVVGLTKGEWANVKRAEAVLPTGKICPSPKPYSNDPNAPAAEIVPQSEWTDGMKNMVDYARFLGKELMGIEITVNVVRTDNNFLAAYGRGELDLNLKRLGQTWFDQGATEDVDKLLIHEFGHQYSGDHLSEDYHEALCLLGARMKRLALERPEELRRFLVK
jgi:hypothetical protein